MTTHMERLSVPEKATSERDIIQESGFGAERFEQVNGNRPRIGKQRVATLRDYGQRSREVGKEERFERLNAGRDEVRRFDTLSPVETRLASQRDPLSSVSFDRRTRGACMPTSARGIDKVQRGAFENAAPAQRSIERMQTITAAALGIIVGFILFLFLLYAG